MGDKRLTILIYSSFPDYSGGRENWLYHVLGRLSRLGYDLTVYSYASDRQAFYSLERLPNLRLVRVPTLRRRDTRFQILNRATLNIALWVDIAIFVRRTFKRLGQRWQEEPVLAMNPIIDVLPGLLLKRRHKKMQVICAVRGQPAWELSRRPPWLPFLFSWLEKRTLSASDLVLANGFDTQTRLARLGVSSMVVPNGVDMERFAVASADAPPVAWLRDIKASGKMVIMMIATLYKPKGIDYLIEAANVLGGSGRKDFQAVFVGKGPKQPYEKMSQRLGVEDLVTFVGEIKDIAPVLCEADISVCLSGGGGMSMAAIESMAAGKPIVAWDTPIFRQLIEHEVSGVLVPDGDSKSLAKAISELMDNPEKRQRLGGAAQKKAQDYDWDVVVERLLAALESVTMDVALKKS